MVTTMGAYLSVILVFAVLTIAILLLTIYILVPFSNHVSKKLKLPKHYNINVEKNKILERGLLATAIISVVLIVILISFAQNLGL